MVLTCLSITVDGAIVIPWTVCCVDLGTSFSQLFEKLQAGSIKLFQHMRSLSNAFTILMSNQVALSQGKVAFIHTCKETNVGTMQTMWYVEATLFQEEAHPIRKTAVAVTFRRCALLLWSYALKNLIFQIPFHQCVSLITTVMIWLSRWYFTHMCLYCASEDLSNSPTSDYYPMCVDCFGSRDPIKKWSSVLYCVKGCFLYAMTTSCVLWP